MNKFEVIFKNTNNDAMIEAHNYKIEGGFVTFSAFGVNILSILSDHVETVSYKGRKEVDDEEFESLRQQFKEEYG